MRAFLLAIDEELTASQPDLTSPSFLTTILALCIYNTLLVTNMITMASKHTHYWHVQDNLASHTAVKVGVPKLGNHLEMYTCAQASAQACTQLHCTRSGQAVTLVYKKWPSSSSSVQVVSKQ